MIINPFIPAQYQNIGVLFSGGMDSSLILYMLGKHYPKRRIMAFTAGCDYINNRVHLDYASNVFNRVTNLLTPGSLDYHIIHYHNDKTTHHCNQAMSEFKNMIDLWVVGINPAPPPGSIVENCYGGKVDVNDICHMPDRLRLSKNIGKNNDYFGEDPITGFMYYRPLINLDKKHIVKLYQRYGIYDTVMPFTRSCPKVWKYEDMNTFTPECGWCYFCLERKWGMSL
jgi:7-cyano-7-deazaguanine synthase in queuosine biosynthesis